MTDLEFVKQYDIFIDEKFKKYVGQNEQFGKYFLQNEKRYWEDMISKNEKGQYVPEMLD